MSDDDDDTKSFDINDVIYDDLLKYIKDHNIIKDNFITIKAFVGQFSKNFEDECYSAERYFTIKDAIVRLFEQNESLIKEIVSRLYAKLVSRLSIEQYKSLFYTTEGYNVWYIIRYVYKKCKQYDKEELLDYLENDSQNKFCSIYMYFKAREILESLWDYEYEVLDQLEELYKEEELRVVSKGIAINKIKRNNIYNLGLGLKLSIKAFNKDFN
jgi:hypothetical protein